MGLDEGERTVRDIAHMTPAEIEVMLDELADDASLVSVTQTDPRHGANSSHHHGMKKGSQHKKKVLSHSHSYGHGHGPAPVRKQRFKDLIWGRAAQHMTATSQQVDPLMKIMREEAGLLGTEMMEEQFGERYSRKSKWEGVEHARQQERRRIRKDKALQQAAALL